MIISNLPPLVKNQTCAVSGHRVLTSNFNEEQLKNDLVKIIEKGYSIFLTGMAQGFDLACFKALLELKKEFKDIKICAVIPCADQSRYYTSEERYAYYDLLESADFIAKEERTYFKGCMLLRNNYLIDNCSLLYAYFNGEKRGGTYYTVKRALEHNISTEYFGDVK